MSSRVCVKNLPKHLTVDRFRQHFQQKGEVTDAKILKTSDGKSRLMGFIGYKTPQEAKDAANFFNNTFLDTSKITVELAKPVGDKNMNRPWSKYSKGSSGNTKLQGEENKSKNKNKEEKETNNDNIQNDKDLNKFLNIMKPRTSGKFWENETIVSDSVTIKAQEAKPKKIKFESSDEEEEAVSEENVKEPQVLLNKNTEEYKLVHDSAISDMDYLMSKKRKLADEEIDSDIPNSDSNVEVVSSNNQKKLKLADSIQSTSQTPSIPPSNSTNSTSIPPSNSTSTSIPPSNSTPTSVPSKKAENESNNKSGSAIPNPGKESTEDTEEDVGSTGRLFVRNLSYSVTEADLIQLFSKYGAIIEVHIPVNTESKKGKGIAFVQYANHQSAIQALSHLDGSIFQGRLIHILPAKSNISSTIDHVKASSFGKSKKEKKENEKKTQSQNEVSWNSLFMRADATADSLASRLQISKGELLDGREISSDNMAVRLALGETHLINETKKVLEKEGVNLDILGKHSDKKFPRSNSVLLVKNIPFDSKLEEFKQMFSRYGELGRVILPPAKTIVLIEFLHANDAKKAFKELSYRKFKHVPLYLEWAPAKLFDGPPPSSLLPPSSQSEDISNEIQTKSIIEPQKETPNEKQREIVKETLIEEDTSSSNSSTVFIKNLNFETTEDSLRDFFANIGEIRNVSIAKKKDMRNPGNMLSMGFGFVEFVRRDDAVKAVKNLQGKQLDDHAVVLKLSVKGQDEQKTKTRKTTQQLPETTKIVIRNVPFEAKKQDIRDLCKAFGQVKSVRLPLKFDGKIRGFAFVEFLTKQEAKNAYEALQNTHLYGRHLVIEYSSVDDQQDLQSIRQKTERYFDSIKATK